MARRDDGNPWWTDFPEPRSVAARVGPEDVFQLLQDHELADKKPRSFLLVDARRTDCTGGTVRGAMNLPAHSFYPTRRILYDLCKQAGIQRVIFYCGEYAPSPDLLSQAAMEANTDRRLFGKAPPSAGVLAALRGCRTMSRKLAAT
jgi:arsenical-resistance protein 2